MLHTIPISKSDAYNFLSSTAIFLKCFLTSSLCHNSLQKCPFSLHWTPFRLTNTVLVPAWPSSLDDGHGSSNIQFFISSSCQHSSVMLTDHRPTIRQVLKSEFLPDCSIFFLFQTVQKSSQTVPFEVYAVQSFFEVLTVYWMTPGNTFGTVPLVIPRQRELTLVRANLTRVTSPRN